MKHEKCPVCGQGGIPDFTTQPTVCPQCESDLKAYSILEKMARQKKKTLLLFFLTGVLLITSVSISIYEKTRKIEYHEEITMNYTKIQALKDSMGQIIQREVELKSKLRKFMENDGCQIVYTVKKGDYLWKIADFYYGDGSQYTRIETDNNLINPYYLQVGQQLVIHLEE